MTEIFYDVTKHTATIDGKLVNGVTRSRARAYPGLVSEAPVTSAFYEDVAERFAGVQSIWDFGCGAGVGVAILREHFPSVFGVDPDASAREVASVLLPESRFVSSIDDIDGSPEAIVLIDVLGHVEAPFATLRSLRARLEVGARVYVAEPQAHPVQLLRGPVRRAFTCASLESLALASGFVVSSWVVRDGWFIACELVAAPDEGGAAMERAAVALGEGDEASALFAYADASKNEDALIRCEAALGEGDLRYSKRDGERACEAYMLARSLSPTDARPVAALAQLMCETGQKQLALELAQQACRLGPADPNALIALGIVLDAFAHSNDEKSAQCAAMALDVWRRAACLASDQALVVSRYAMAALTEDPSGALFALERVRSFGDPEPVDANIAMGHVLLALGRKQDAHVEVKAALSKAPNQQAVMDLWKKFHDKA